MTSKVIEFSYKVITSGELNSLCSEVVRAAMDGWEPQGGIALSWVEGHNRPLYAQAIVLRVKA